MTLTTSSPPPEGASPPQIPARRRRTDRLFMATLIGLGGAYVLWIGLLVLADLSYTTPASLWRALSKPEIRYALILSVLSASIATILSLWVAVPIGYLMSRAGLGHGDGGSGRVEKTIRRRFRRYGFLLVDAILDIPIVLPPLVVGISLLVLFRFAPFRWVSDYVVYEVPAVILAQFTVACAFAVRTLRATFEQIPARQEQVAMTLGASRSRAFWTVLLPQTRSGLLAAGTLCWARAIGEFGPVLVFASSTRMRTEVLPTSVYLEVQAGNLTAALAVSVCMVVCALVVLTLSRLIGWRSVAV